MFKCNKCNINKDKNEYYHTKKRRKPYRIPTCKNCLKSGRKPKPISFNQQEYSCSLCLSNKPISEFSKDRYAPKGITSQCKSCRNKYKKSYTKSEKGIETRTFYQYSKYHNNDEYRLLHNVRNRINSALKRSKQLKNNKTVEILGCSIESYKLHLESLFKDGMSWKNRSLWHIDHIRPIDSFDLSDLTQLKECFHYSNTQPLWADDNLKKSNKT